MPETATRRYTAAASGDLLVALRRLDPDTLLGVRDLAEQSGCTPRAATGWVKRLGVLRVNVPGVAHLYRAGDLVAAITGER